MLARLEESNGCKWRGLEMRLFQVQSTYLDCARAYLLGKVYHGQPDGTQSAYCLDRCEPKSWQWVTFVPILRKVRDCPVGSCRFHVEGCLIALTYWDR